MRKILTAALLLLGITAFAQQHSVKGTVTDQNGYPVIGMAVQEQGTSNGVVTDENGEYSITVASPQASLEFNSLGYETVIEQVNGRAVIDVVSSESAIALDAVVAIGYGAVKKQDLTTAVSVVSNEDMKLRPVSDASGFIQGKVAGVQVQQTSGLPGGGMTVRIRGASSIASSNDPLYVVDGVPVGEGNYAIAYLSPNDIESMSILKDASSAAIYGSRAANGVVLITTKQGKVSQGPQINFSAYVGLSNVTKTYDVLNVAQYKDLMDEIGGATLPDGLRDETDWFDETYSTGITQNYQISVSNGNEKLRYYIGGGYTDEKGVIDVAYNRRYNIKASVDSDLFKWISVGANVAYSSYKSNGIISGTGSNRAGVVLSVINTPTYAKIWSDENPDWYWNTFYGANLTTPAENMARTENNYSQTDRLLLTGYATIKFHKNLNFKSTVTMDRRWVHDYSFLDPIHTSYGRTQHGEASSTRSDDMRMVYDNILTYNNTWNGVHNFEAMGGTSATTSRWENLSGSRNYFSPDYNNVVWGLNGGNKGGLRGQSQGYAKWAIMSYLARVSYNYDSRYYITANFRADGSSKLAPGHRWGFFPSVSAAWRISGESWMKDISWISDLKLRAGWGKIGNVDLYPSDVAYAPTLNYDWAIIIGGNSYSGSYLETMPNFYARWETTEQTSVGLDLTLFNSLDITVDWYNKITKDLVDRVPIVGHMGVENDPYGNIGNVLNRGWEFSVNYNGSAANGQVSYNVWGNYSYNKNEVREYGVRKEPLQHSEPLLNSSYLLYSDVGQPWYSFLVYKTDGIFRSQDEIDNYVWTNPETGQSTQIQPDAKVGDLKFVDTNGDGTISDDDREFMGSYAPVHTFSFGGSINWKGFDFSIMFQGVAGNYVYNGLKQMAMNGRNDYGNLVTDVLDTWDFNPSSSKYPRLGLYEDNNGNYTKFSDLFLEKGDYLRLKNITLGYTLPKFAKNMPGIRFYFSCDNVCTITGYSGIDPEVGNYGIDSGVYPLTRFFNFGINLNF